MIEPDDEASLSVDDEGYTDVPTPRPPSAGPSPPPGPTPFPSGRAGPQVPDDEAASDERVESSYMDLSDARRRGRDRFRGGPPSARRRAHALAALGVVFAAMTVAVGAVSTTEYRVISLEAAGAFFSLAIDGQDLYAASFNGGAVLLERSTDMGQSWAPVSVPYDATIAPGGVDWNYAVAALDGPNVVLVAATGAVGPGSEGSAPPCGTGSTLLLAYSPNGGASWSTVNETALPGAVSWMNAALVGSSAAVAWVSENPNCANSGEQVLAMASTDGGASWGAPQSLSGPNASLPDDGHLEMTAGDDGLVVGFVQALQGQSAELQLFRFNAALETEFQPFGELYVGSSWTLQGEPTTTPFLLTPSYLVPLGNLPLTAINFGELQADGGSLAQLPTLTSLVDLGGGSVEVAASMPQGSGVDCWQIDLQQVDAVTQSCHVPLGAFLQPGSMTPPLVALLDGGGWWLGVGAISGAGSSECSGDCPSDARPLNSSSPPPSTGGAAPSQGAFEATGVSICWVGCAAGGGLDAYYYEQAPPVEVSTLQAVAAAAFVAGGLWFLTSREERDAWPRRRARPSAPSSSSLMEPLLPTRAARAATERTYREGLAVWVLCWLPVALLLFVPGGPSVSAWMPALIVACGAAGTLAAAPFHGTLRRDLQSTHGVLTPHLFGRVPLDEPMGFAFGPVRRAARWAAVSWLAAGATALAALPFLLGDASLSSATTYDSVETSTQLGAGGYLLALLVLFTLFARVQYHQALAEAASLARTSSEPATLKTRLAGDLAGRTRLGALLLPANPLAGLLLGWALQPAFPAGPYLLPGVFLLATLAGAALLRGAFGRTAWAPEALPRSSPRTRGALAG